MNIIVAGRNAPELDAMKALADRYGFPHAVLDVLDVLDVLAGAPIRT